MKKRSNLVKLENAEKVAFRKFSCKHRLRYSRERPLKDLLQEGNVFENNTFIEDVLLKQVQYFYRLTELYCIIRHYTHPRNFVLDGLEISKDIFRPLR